MYEFENCKSVCVFLEQYLLYYLALFQLRQYNKALSILERLFKIVEPLGKVSYIYFNTVRAVFFLILKVFSFVLHYFAEQFA